MGVAFGLVNFKNKNIYNKTVSLADRFRDGKTYVILGELPMHSELQVNYLKACNPPIALSTNIVNAY